MVILFFTAVILVTVAFFLVNSHQKKLKKEKTLPEMVKDIKRNALESQKLKSLSPYTTFQKGLKEKYLIEQKKVNLAPTKGEILLEGSLGNAKFSLLILTEYKKASEFSNTGLEEDELIYDYITGEYKINMITSVEVFINSGQEVKIKDVKALLSNTTLIKEDVLSNAFTYFAGKFVPAKFKKNLLKTGLAVIVNESGKSVKLEEEQAFSLLEQTLTEDNNNVVISGVSGAGKTVFAEKILQRLFNTCFILSTKELLQVSKGELILPRQGTRIIIYVDDFSAKGSEEDLKSILDGTCRNQIDDISILISMTSEDYRNLPKDLKRTGRLSSQVIIPNAGKNDFKILGETLKKQGKFLSKKKFNDLFTENKKTATMAEIFSILEPYEEPEKEDTPSSEPSTIVVGRRRRRKK